MEITVSQLIINSLIEEGVDKIFAYQGGYDKDIFDALYHEKDIELIRRAYDYAEKKHFGQKRISGDDYILHPLNVPSVIISRTSFNTVFMLLPKNRPNVDLLLRLYLQQ